MGSPETDRRAEELARRAARLLRRSRPALEKAVTNTRPRVEKAAKDAWHYTQEHEDEIKRTVLKAARLRVRGPLGFLFDAVNNGLREQGQPKPGARACAACSANNPLSARFCSQCGAQLGSDQ